MPCRCNTAAATQCKLITWHPLACCAATNSLRIPKVLAWGDTSNGSYLIIEHLNFGGRADQADMGRQLALMHKAEPKVLVYLQQLPLAPIGARSLDTCFGRVCEDMTSEHAALVRPHCRSLGHKHSCTTCEADILLCKTAPAHTII